MHKNELAALFGQAVPSEHGKGTVKYVAMRPYSEYVRIANMPTIYDNNHESIYRAGGILRKVKELLEKGVPGDVVLELIHLMETDTEEILNQPPAAQETDP